MALICFSVFLSVWATCFQVLWQRKENFYRHHWGSIDCERDEVVCRLSSGS